MGINKSENNSKALWRSTHLVLHISFNFFLFSPCRMSCIQISNVAGLLGELLKKRAILSATCIMLLTSLMLQHFTMQRFNLWEAQWVYIALGYFAVIRDAAPFTLPVIAPAPSCSYTWCCTFYPTCHSTSSIISLTSELYEFYPSLFRIISPHTD